MERGIEKAVQELRPVINASGLRELERIAEHSERPFGECAALLGIGSTALTAIADACIAAAPEWLRGRVRELVAPGYPTITFAKRTRIEFESLSLSSPTSMLPMSLDGDNDDEQEGADAEELAEKRKKSDDGGVIRVPKTAARRWGKEEDRRLVELVAKHGTDDWKLIAAQLGTGRTGSQCGQHWHRVTKPSLRKGTWSEDEERRLLELAAAHGQGKWALIAAAIPGRSDISCRYQWLRATASRAVPWTAQEDSQLVALVSAGMQSWIEVSRYLGRTRQQDVPRTALECLERFKHIAATSSH
jgi:hypothetical protein